MAWTLLAALVAVVYMVCTEGISQAMVMKLCGESEIASACQGISIGFVNACGQHVFSWEQHSTPHLGEPVPSVCISESHVILLFLALIIVFL